MPRITRIGPKGPQGGPILATRPPFAQAREAPVKHQKRPGPWAAAASFSRINPGRSGSQFLAKRLQRLDRADHDLEFDHFIGSFSGDIVARSEANGLTMQDDREKHEVHTGAFANKSSKGAKQDRRQDRLKQALRENLKRRKSQARGRDDLLSAPSNVDDGSPYDGSGNKPGK
jgi:hypothetical protein